MNRRFHLLVALLLCAVLGVAFLLFRVLTRRSERRGGATASAASRSGADEDPEDQRARARAVRERIRELTWSVEAPRFLLGTVRSAKGPAVVGAQVRVVLDDGATRVARTDGRGEYTLANVPARAKAMEVSAPGFATRTFEPLTLPASPRVRWDVTLDPAEGVHGVVLVGDTPAPGALVTLLGRGARPHPVRTDSGGRFSLQWPAGGGAAQVVASHPQHGRAQQAVSGPGEVTLRLPGGGFVLGRVEDDRGSPVTRFGLSTPGLARSASGEASQRFEDARGQFRLGPLAPGRQQIIAFAEGYQPTRGRTVVVRAGEETAGVVLVLKASGEVYGRITDASSGKPIPGAVVLPAEWGGPRLGQAAGAVADASGEYRLASVPGGRTSLTVRASGYQPLLAGGVNAPAGVRFRRDFALTPLARGERPRGQITGIGAVLQRTPNGVAIRSLIQGGPAESSLQAGDVVVMIGDEDVRSADLSRVAQAIRGEEGTDVVLWVQRGDGPPQRVVLRRAVVNFPQRGR